MYPSVVRSKHDCSEPATYIFSVFVSARGTISLDDALMALRRSLGEKVRQEVIITFQADNVHSFGALHFRVPSLGIRCALRT